MTTKYRSLSGYYRYKTVLHPKISKEQFLKLRKYANAHGIVLSDFRDYTGDIDEIIDIIDKIVLVAKDFPKILEDKNRIILKLYFADNEEFAGTDNHTIVINGYFYDDVISLKKDYELMVLEKQYIEGTTYKDIIFHELGHVVCNVYNLNALDIFRELTGLTSCARLIEFAAENISLYSAEKVITLVGDACFDASEVIAECFCAYYSGASNWFSSKYVEKCRDYIQGGRAMKFMSMNTEKTYWLTNKEWYRINEEKDCFEMLPNAPTRAKMSFEIWDGKRKSKKKRDYFSRLQ